VEKTELVISSLPHRIPYALDPAHPDRERWQRAIDAAVPRGELVCSVLEKHLALRGARVLDFGCGVGGTSIALHEHGADVIAMDRNPARLEALAAVAPQIRALLGDAENTGRPPASCDAVVLQDMIEHTRNPLQVLREAARVLAPRGVLYLSTPNKQALFNLAADPHWGLPFVAPLRRPVLRRILAQRRPMDADRDDLAQLLSWRQLHSLLDAAGFTVTLELAHVAAALFMHPESVVWSDAHLRFVRWAKRLGFRSFVPLLEGNRVGLLKMMTIPAWYIIARKGSQ
jgi:2-polyprenyl-3-methyl-5-hydroxy-6-metoxy-1,4-benzoquinol methylase